MTLTNLREREEGFTLIELLVVIIIIGILAAIAIPTFLNQREKGWDAAAKSALKNAAVAQESFFTENNSYTLIEDDPDAGIQAEGWNPSDDVTLTVATATATAYCMQASHDAAPTRFWSLSSASGTLAQAAC